MTEQTTQPVIPFTEAPASWNTYYFDPSGFKCQLTLRDTNGKDLLKKAEGALKFLTDQGCTPAGYHDSGNSAEAAKKTPDMMVCEIHNAEMKKHEKDGQVWFSHKLADGTYCKGKSK